MYDTVYGVEVRREVLVVLLGVADELCEALDGVRGVFREMGIKSCDYGVDEVLDWGREDVGVGFGRGLGWRGVFFVCTVVG